MSRRAFIGGLLAAGAALALPGCGAQPMQASSTLPGPTWPDAGSDDWTLGSPTVGADVPGPPRAPVVVAGGVLSRNHWTRQGPTYTRMSRMVPVRYITVHHTGQAFSATEQGSTASHLESIRRYHCGDRGWGDIGYHYAVDRAGRVWECRPVGWQGAHVRDHNEGNIGVVVLGNFDRQSPTTVQVEAVHRHVQSLLRNYRVPVSRLRTHQEWAPTACPGRSLQRVMVSSRAGGRFA
ncbi:MAG: peptidoglycan recognition protein family protein [Planctomycetota bacterium]